MEADRFDEVGTDGPRPSLKPMSLDFVLSLRDPRSPRDHRASASSATRRMDNITRHPSV